jgi:hypothetical protein
MPQPLAERIRVFYAIAIPFADGLLDEPDLDRMRAAAADLEEFAGSSMVVQTSIEFGSRAPMMVTRITLPIERAVGALYGLDSAGLTEFGVALVEGLLPDEDLYTPAVEHLLWDFFEAAEGVGVEIIGSAGLPRRAENETLKQSFA